MVLKKIRQVTKNSFVQNSLHGAVAISHNPALAQKARLTSTVILNLGEI